MSSEASNAAHERLAMVAVMRKALDQHNDLLDVLTHSDDERAAVEAVRAMLGCDAEQANQVLSLQLRRLTRQGRSRLAEEAAQRMDELVGAGSPADDVPDASSNRALYVRVSTPIKDSRPLPATERAKRRHQQTADRREILRALAQLIREPTAALEAIHNAVDAAAAADDLAAQYGWTPLQALAAVDMQFRGFLSDRQRRIAAELQTD
jgi:DNA gyrase/topoisomerase IV subunit A